MDFIKTAKGGLDFFSGLHSIRRRSRIGGKGNNEAE